MESADEAAACRGVDEFDLAHGVVYSLEDAWVRFVGGLAGLCFGFW